jgi:hypothetical protein
VDFGCVPKENLLTLESNTCNCDCPHLKNHPDQIWEVIPYVCQVCRREKIKLGQEEPGKVICRVCNRIIPEGCSVCNYCSSGQALCLICGTSVPQDSEVFDGFPGLKVINRTGVSVQSSTDSTIYFLMEQTDGHYLVIHTCQNPTDEQNKSITSQSKADQNNYWKLIVFVFGLLIAGIAYIYR